MEGHFFGSPGIHFKPVTENHSFFYASFSCIADSDLSRNNHILLLAEFLIMEICDIWLDSHAASKHATLFSRFRSYVIIAAGVFLVILIQN